MMAEEFFSDEAVKKGTTLWYYTETMRNILRKMTEDPDNKLADGNRQMYSEKLGKLRQYCPENKKTELEKVIEIVEDKKKDHVMPP